jgi:hypothetical protein
MKTSRTYLIRLEGGGGYILIGRVISRTINTVELGQNVVKRIFSVVINECNVMVNNK